MSLITSYRLSLRGRILAYLNILQRIFILLYVYVIDHGEKAELGFGSAKSRKFFLSSYSDVILVVLFYPKGPQRKLSHFRIQREKLHYIFGFDTGARWR